MTDIIKQPVMALLDLTDLLATTWRKYAATGASIYHEHNMPDPFYAYVDSQVASAYLNLMDPAAIAPGSRKFRYRAVTVLGIPDDNCVWDLAQETAVRTAASTHEPIREGAMILPDDFIPIQSADLKDISRNAGVTVDEISPFADRRNVVQVGKDLILDRHYGLAYHTMELRTKCVRFYARASACTG